MQGAQTRLKERPDNHLELKVRFYEYAFNAVRATGFLIQGLNRPGREDSRCIGFH